MERSVDLVIPMVFPQDPEWQRQYGAEFGKENNSAVMCRWRSWGTEELLVRCCLRYMPWLRRIHILLSGEGQVQPWMQILNIKHGTLNIVYHRDFIPREYLPCFASPCIEMFLDGIPGLSERFIYANDDMFPLSPLEETDFFRDGLPCHHMTLEPLPPSPNMFHRKCIFQQEMVGAPYDRIVRARLMRFGHSFAPILRDSCREVWHSHAQEILGRLSPKKRTDHSYNHYAYLLQQYFSGRYVDHAPREQMAGSDVSLGRIGEIIRDPGAGIVCFQDNAATHDWQERAKLIRREIAAKLGI